LQGLRDMDRIPEVSLRALCSALLGLWLAAIAHAELFRLSNTVFPVGPNPSAIAAPDLNGDGLPEIVTANTGTLTDPREERPAGNEVSLLVAQGDLKYAAQPPLVSGYGPYCIAVQNVDALPAPDLVVGSFHAVYHNDIAVFRNIKPEENRFETLYFTIPDEFLPYTKQCDGDGRPLFTVPGITSLVVDHFNGDGYRDIIATGWACDRLVFLPGHSDKYFGAASFIEAHGGPRDVKAADFDGDGHLDLVVTLYSANALALWKGDGQGNFEHVTYFPSVADFNGDGVKDLLVSHRYADDSVVVFYGNGGFQFPVSQEILLGKDRDVPEQGIRDLVCGDFNSDGHLDLAAACFGSSQVIVLVNMSKDTSMNQSYREERYTFKKGRPAALCIADFDNNGKPDLGVALWETNSVGLLLNK